MLSSISYTREKRHRVLILDLAKYYGGADVRVLELARALDGFRYPYAVGTLAGSPLHQQLVKENLASLPVPFSRGDLRLLLFLICVIRRGHFDILDAHNPQSQFWGQMASIMAGGVKLISTVHSAYRLEHKG